MALYLGTESELIEEFQTLVNYTAAELTSIYSSGEPDFDPTGAQENEAQNLIDRLMRLKGLDYDAAVNFFHAHCTFA